MTRIMKDHAAVVRQLPRLDPADDIQRDINPCHVEHVWQQREIEAAQRREHAALERRNRRRKELGLPPLERTSDRFYAGLYGA